MNIGFIGTGNMGGALINGYIKSNQSGQIFVFDTNPKQIKKFDDMAGVTGVKDLEELIKRSDIIVLAVKPNIFDSLLPDIKDTIDRLDFTDQNVFVSIAAGISIKYMTDILGADSKIIRTMPNLASMSGAGMTGVARNDNVKEDAFSAVMELFSSVGKAIEVNENLMDTVTGISGSSPAYVFMFIEALMDCAVKNGMTVQDARIFASQAVFGAAVTLMESNEDPETLVENVCSPGGTTIEAVMKLKENGFKDNIEEAATAAIEKSKKMTK